VKKFPWNVANEVKFGEKGGDVQIKAWLAQAGAGGTREDAIKKQFAAGLDSGRARIIKLYATNKSGKEGRQGGLQDRLECRRCWSRPLLATTQSPRPLPERPQVALIAAYRLRPLTIVLATGRTRTRRQRMVNREL
jgi:hypothetical protein